MIALETPRLVLRRWSLDDAPALVPIYGDPETMRWFADGSTFTLEEIAASLVPLIAEYERYGYGNYAVVERATGAILGHAGARFVADRSRNELDIALHRTVWGRGYGAEVGRALLDAAFARGIPAVFAVARRENAAAVALMRRLGMRFVEELSAHGAPSVLYGIERRA